MSPQKSPGPVFAGKKIPPEHLDDEEVTRLLETYDLTDPSNARDHAAIILMYRHGVKFAHLKLLDRRYYQANAKELVIPPAGKAKGGQKIKLDRQSRDAMKVWIDRRSGLGVSVMSPWFCATGDDPMKPMDSSGFRQCLARHRDRAGIAKRVTPEGLRISGIDQTNGQRYIGARFRSNTGHLTFTGAHVGVEREVADHMRRGSFPKRYPLALEKWLGAQALYEDDPIEHASRIGHDCREAMILFADELLAALNLVPASGPTNTIDRLRQALDSQKDRLGDTVTAFLEGLLNYWGTVWDLAQRQEHSALREREALGLMDGQRLILHTMLVMYELDVSLVVSKIRAQAAPKLAPVRPEPGRLFGV